MSGHTYERKRFHRALLEWRHSIDRLLTDSLHFYLHDPYARLYDVLDPEWRVSF